MTELIYRQNDVSTNSTPIDKIKPLDLKLDWTVDFNERVIKGSATYILEIIDGSLSKLSFDLSGITVSQAHINGKEARFIESHVEFFSSVKIVVPLELRRKGVRFTVQFDYKTGPNASAIQWLDPEATKGANYPYIFTQSQAIHARSLFPCFDSPGIKMTYKASVTVPVWCTVLMSALSEKLPVKQNDEYITYYFTQPVPVPSYLVALAAGNLVSATISNRVKVWAEPEMIEAVAWEFSQTEDFLKAAEELTCDYVWGQYDVLCLPPSFPYGGMENPCLTFATPTLLAGDRSLANVIAHEIAHSWTGNLVTNATWNHFWLNEGWTIWLERNIMAKVTGDKEGYKLSAQGGWKHLEDDVSRLNPSWTSLVWPLEAGSDPDDAFSSVPYEKGFALLTYLESLVGEYEFKLFAKAYIQHYKYQTITSGEFKDYFCDYFKYNKTLHDLNWVSLLMSQGLPKHPIPDYTNKLSLQVDEVVKQILTYNENNGVKTTTFLSMDGWITEQKTLFFDLLLDATALSEKTLLALDTQYHFTKNHNSEVKFRWHMLCLKSKVNWILPHVEVFLKDQGRMKFIRPLYRALRDGSSEAKQLSLKVFESHKQKYHPVASKMVANDLYGPPPTPPTPVAAVSNKTKSLPSTPRKPATATTTTTTINASSVKGVTPSEAVTVQAADTSAEDINKAFTDVTDKSTNSDSNNEKKKKETSKVNPYTTISLITATTVVALVAVTAIYILRKK